MENEAMDKATAMGDAITHKQGMIDALNVFWDQFQKAQNEINSKRKMTKWMTWN